MKNLVFVLCIYLCAIQSLNAQNLKSIQTKNFKPTHELINEKEFNYQKLGADQSQTNYRNLNPGLLKSSDTEYGITPEWIWAEQFGGSGNDYARDIVPDSAGNVYVTGSFSGEITIGLNTLVSSGNSDGFIAKFDNSGSMIWISQIQASVGESVESNSICLDYDGNILITGSYTDYATFNDIQLSGAEFPTMFLAKYNYSGEMLMARNYGNFTEGEGKSIVVDRNNNIYLLTSENSLDRIARFDNNMNLIWTKTGSNSPYPGSIGIKDSCLYYAGTFRYDLYLGDIYLTSASYYDNSFLAKADLDGNFEWAVTGKPTGQFDTRSNANGLEIDNDGSVYFFGSVYYDIIFGSDTLIDKGTGQEGYIAKCSPGGEFIWARRADKAVVDGAADMSDNIYIYYDGFITKFDSEGSEQLTAELENNPTCLNSDKSNNKLVLAGSSSGLIFISQMDNNITEEWLLQFAGNSGNGYIIGMVTDSLGYLYAYGYASATTEYFGETVQKGSFLCKLNGSGSIIWIKQLQNIQVNYGYGNYIAIDPENENLYITGYFHDPLILNDTLYPDESGSVFLIKYSVDGQLKWVIQEDVPQTYLSVSPDYSGNIILCGNFSDTVVVGNSTLISEGYDDMFITKYDTDGNPLWTDKAGGESVEYWGLVSTDSSDNIYFTGEFLSENITFNETEITLSDGDGNIIFSKLDPQGNVLWIKSHGGSPGTNDGNCWPTFIKTDPEGYSYIKGWHGDQASFNDFVLSSPYGMGYSFFIGKFDPDGNCIWVNSITEHTYSFDFNQMDIDRKGNCYLGAQIRDTIHFGDNFDYVNVGRYDLFVAKYTSDGKLSWVKTMEGSTGYNWLSSVAVSNSYIYVGGLFNPLISFDDTALYSSSRNGFIAKLGQHLGITPDKIDFGKVEIGADPSSKEVTVGNSGSEDLTVSDISGLDSIFSFSGLPSLPLVLPPDSSFTFDIAFSPVESIEYSDTVSVTSTDPDKPIQHIILSGEGIIVMPADSGVFYASTVSDTCQLIIINPSSGKGTPVGEFGHDYLYGLAINSQGVLYSADYSNGDLYRVDAATGTAVYTVSTGLESILALAFDTADVLYAVSASQLYIIDLASGFSKPVGDQVEYIYDIVFDPEQGILWGATWDGKLLKIDPESGEVISILNTDINTGITGLTMDFAGNLFAISYDEDDNIILLFINKNNGRTNLIGEVGIANTFSLECFNVPVQGKHINVFPDSLNYGIIELGKTNTLQIFISNTGTDTVSITGLAFPDSIFTVPNPPVLPLSIVPGTSEYLDVVFAPEDSIRYSDTLDIIVDVKGDSLVSVLLVGQGIIIMPADSGMCYASTGYDGGGLLLMLDPDTGAGSEIGPTGLNRVYSIDIDSSGMIYGADRYSGDLYRIDAATGRSLLVASTGLSNIYAMAFDSKNVLYIISSGYLYTVDPATGITEEIGYTGHSIIGISFNPIDGSLWGIMLNGYLYTISTESGYATYNGTTGISGYFTDLHFDFAGNLFAVSGGTYDDNVLVRIDPGAGYSEAVGVTGIQDIEGLAFYKVPVEGTHIRYLPSFIDFGSVETGDTSYNRVLTFSNVGTESLFIDSISETDYTMILSGLTTFPITIGSGSSLSVKVNFAPMDCGFVTDSLVVYCNDADNENITITLSGRGVSDNCPIIVNSTGDAGDMYSWDGMCDDGEGNCTLRAAIQEANNRAGTDTIRFDITGPGPHTIQPNSQFPLITDQVMIDGTSEPDFNGTPIIELDGSKAGEEVAGLIIGCPDNTIKGLIINRFPHSGIDILEGNNIIQGNFIGTDVSGMKDSGNGGGILIISGYNIIGGTKDETRNIISGNENDGILLIESGAFHNLIQGNFIGTDVTGTSAIGNGTGIWIGSKNNTIGGTDNGAANVISGNYTGITIVGVDDLPGSGNIIQGNFIGTDLTGTVALGNEAGINLEFNAKGNIIGGSYPNAGNIIAGNIWDGIAMYAVDGQSPENNVVQGNFIGTNSANDILLGNDRGVYIDDAYNNSIGGIDPDAGNVIAFNRTKGITILSGTGNGILSNSIYSNAELGIDLLEDGITGNDDGDIDSGPNNLQNYPEIIRTGIIDNGNLVVKYTVDSDPANAAYPLTIQFFKTANRNSSKKLLGTHIFTAGDIDKSMVTVDLGNASGLGIKTGGKITSTATDADNNTSELSELSTVGTFVSRDDVNSDQARLRFYPNPFTYRTTIEFPNPEGKTYTLILTDLTGKQVRIISPITTGTYVLKREFLPAGVYIIELRGSDNYRDFIVIE